MDYSHITTHRYSYIIISNLFLPLAEPLAWPSAHSGALSSHLATSLMPRATPVVVDKLCTATNGLE